LIANHDFNSFSYDFRRVTRKKTKLQGQEKYVFGPQETGRTRRHSNFWIGLYGSNWLSAFNSCQEWVESMLSFVRNKKSFYQKGLRAIKLIGQAL
jgi:hypothetical protein